MQNRAMEPGDAGEGDSALERVVEELRTLRRAQVRTSYDFNRAPTLLWHLGRGNVDVASAFFRQLPRVGSLHIDAAIASLGFNPDVVNVEDRMNDFALRAGAESTRTVRRWADAGFRLIAQMALDWSAEEGHDHPLLEIEVHPRGDGAVLIEVSCIMQAGMAMLRPEIDSGEGVVPWLEDPMEREQLDPPVTFRAKAVVDFPGDDESLRSIQVRWLGAVEAYYVVELHPGVMQEYKLRTLTTKKGCELLFQPLVPPDDVITY